MEESGDFSTVLIGDMTAAMRRLKDDHHPRESRTCVRTAFAAVEGHLATLCNELLAKAAGGLTETERMALREETYRVDATGNIQTVPAHQPLKQRVRLVITIVKKLHPEYAIDFESKGWQSLLLGLDVRHRLTHSKSREDMSVEREEVITTIGCVLVSRDGDFARPRRHCRLHQKEPSSIHVDRPSPLRPCRCLACGVGGLRQPPPG